MKKIAKHLLPVLILLAAAALFAGLSLLSQADASVGIKAVTVEVVHGDGSAKTFHYQTDTDYLGALLLSEGLIKGDAGPYGLYITEVDGEVADYSQNQSFWAVFIGEEYATTGADLIPLTDGCAYALVYTIG